MNRFSALRAQKSQQYNHMLMSGSHKPGSSRHAKRRPPLTQAITLLEATFVVSAASTGSTTSLAAALPDCASKAAEAAAACASPKPLSAVDKSTP